MGQISGDVESNLIGRGILWFPGKPKASTHPTGAETEVEKANQIDGCIRGVARMRKLQSEGKVSDEAMMVCLEDNSRISGFDPEVLSDLAQEIIDVEKILQGEH